MATDNVELVRRFYDALSADDLASMRELCDKIEYVNPAQAAEPGTRVGLDAFRAAFSWDDARKLLDGLPDGGLNIAYEAVDRHAAGERRDLLKGLDVLEKALGIEATQLS